MDSKKARRQFKRREPSLKGRRPDIRRMSPMVRRLLSSPDRYEYEAKPDTGEGFLDIEFVSPERKGASPAIHARWQKESYILDLEDDEKEALARAGFVIIKDSTSYAAFWRERGYTHLWVSIWNAKWVFSHSPRARTANWANGVMSDMDDPSVPMFASVASSYTPTMIVLNALTEAIPRIKEECPPRIYNDSRFVQGLEKLVLHEINSIEEDEDFLEDIMAKRPVSQPVLGGCPSCTKNLDEILLDPEEMQFCPFCGTEIRREEKYGETCNSGGGN